MSARQVWIVGCDAPGCVRSINAGERSATRTREYAHRNGWTYEAVPRRSGPAQSVDLCPDHAQHGEARA